MALVLVHSPQTPPVPSTSGGDSRDYQTLAAVQTQIIATQNGAGHSLTGATTGDLLVATSPTTLGVISAPGSNQILTSAGAGTVPTWTAAPTLGTTLQIGTGTSAAPQLSFGGTTNGFALVATNQLGAFTSGFLRWTWDNAGNYITATDGAYDVGSVGSRPRDGRFARDLYTGNATFLLRATTTLTNNAAAQTATLTNGPTAGNPTKWIAIDDNGTTRFIPCW